MGLFSSVGGLFKKASSVAMPFLSGSELGDYLGAAMGSFEGISAAKQPSTDASFNMQSLGNQFSSIEAARGRAYGSSEAEKARAWAGQQATTDRSLATQFAQQGIRWRAADAKAAGIHPLAAIGGATYSPPSVSAGGTSVSSPQSMGANIPGQNLSRARRATMSNVSRHDERMAELAIERAGLENAYLRSRIATEVAQLGPGLPVEDVSMQRVPGHVSSPSQEPGSVTSSGWIRTGDGGLQKVPSLDAKERIEDQVVPEAAWALSNTFRDYIGKGTPPPNSMKPRGTVWKFRRMTNTWYPVYPSRKKPYVIPKSAGGYNRSRSKWRGSIPR